MKTSKSYSIKEARKNNLDKIAEIQTLKWDVQEEHELAHDFEMEGDEEMAEASYDHIRKQNMRIKKLLSDLTRDQIELMMTVNVIYVDGEGGSDKIIVEKA